MSIKNWYPFYPMDFLRDTEKLSLEERCLYREMLDIYWINEGEISEKEAKKLAKRRDFSSQKFDKCWRKIRDFFPVSDGKLTNPRMDEELDRARSKHEKAVKNGSAGGLANARKKEGQKPKQEPTSPPPPSPSQQQIGSIPPNGGTFTYQVAEESQDAVFSRALEWAQHMITTYGYSMAEVQTAETVPMFRAWCDARVTVGEVNSAMSIAWGTLGQLPDGPRYLDKIIKRQRGAASSQAKSGPIPAKHDNAALAAELRNEMMMEAANAH